MDDSSKKDDDAQNPGPDETWVEKLRGSVGKTPANVTVYVGLLRKSPSDENVYELYLTLDMSSHLQIQKPDVVYVEDLPADKSPFGGLGGARVYVRIGAKIKSVRTATSTFEAGSDEFDLDVRLGSRGSAASARLQSGTDCAVFNCLTIDAPTWADTTCQVNNPITDTCFLTGCGNTCVFTNCATCVTCATCRTCHTQCGPCLTLAATQCRATCGPACGVIQG
jgi:hypothetical protein